MRKLAVVVFLVPPLWMVSATAEEATKLREEISVPVDYQGRQIQLTGWFEKPATAGPFPVVIVLHSCSGYYANMAGGSLPGWVGFLQQHGYATFKFDSFTARGQSEVCASNAVTAGDRAADVLAAAALLAGRRDVRPDRIAAIGFSHGGGTAVYVARDHLELRPLRAQLAARGGRLVASIGLYPGCGSPEGNPVIVPLLALSGGLDDWTPAARCVAMGARVAEIDQDAVAHVLGDKAVIAPDRRAAPALIRCDHIAQILGVHPGRECGRSHQVAKHHGQLATLGVRHRGSSSRRSRGGRSTWPERRDRRRQSRRRSDRRGDRCN